MSYKLPVLKNCKGDLAKPWYVEYRIENPSTLSMERRKVMLPKKLNAEQRYVRGAAIVKELTKKIQSGWTPFLQEAPAAKTIDQAIEIYLTQKRTHLRTLTIKAYLKGTKELIEWLTIIKKKNIPVSMFTKHMAMAHIDYLMTKGGKGVITINKRIKFLRGLFQEFLSRGYIEANPFHSIKTLKQPKHGIKSYSDQELALLFKTLKEQDQQMYMYCGFIFYLGLRPLEISQIKKKDFDLEKRIITIPAEVAKNWTTQTVKIPDNFFVELKEYLDKIETTQLIFSIKMLPGNVCVSTQTYSDRFKRYANNLGLKNTAYHLKHTAIGLAFRCGHSPREVQIHFRHANLQTTMQYYAAFKAMEISEIAKHYPSPYKEWHLN